MSKIIVIEYLPPARPKLVPKLKVFRIYRNLAHSIVQICQFQFWCRKFFLPIARLQLVPKWKMLRIYWNLSKLIFQICQSQFWCQKWFLLNIFDLLGPNCSKIKGVQNLLTHLIFLVFLSWFNVKIIFIYQILTNC